MSLAVDLTAVRPGVVDRLLGRSDREPTYGDAIDMYEALGLEPPPFVHFDFKAARTLAALVDAALTRDRPVEVVPARGDYEIILADMPWEYTPFGTAKLPYKCMSEAELKAFDWSVWMAKRCVIFLWVTGPKLDLQFRCIEAWKAMFGLRYVGKVFTWIKTTRAGVPIGASGPRPTITKPLGEDVVALTNVKRGRPFPLLTESMVQWCFESDLVTEAHEVAEPKVLAGEHSRKPAVVRDKIHELFGLRPSVELFARERVDNWAGWGDEYPAEAEVLRG